VEPLLQLSWTWTVRVFVTLGGFAGMTKIWDWFTDKPKLKIFWEQDTIGNQPTTVILGYLHGLGKGVK